MKILKAIKGLVATAGTKNLIENDLSESECRRAVKVLARRAIARRARFLVSQGWKPGKALEQARTEYKSQHGGFR